MIKYKCKLKMDIIIVIKSSIYKSWKIKLNLTNNIKQKFLIKILKKLNNSHKFR